MHYCARLLICLLIAATAIVGHANATDWYVKDDGTGDVADIATAIASASSGDKIVLAAGTFTGAGNRDLQITDKVLVITSESGPSVTTIDCQNLGYGIYFMNTTGSTMGRIEVTGITVVNASGVPGAIAMATLLDTIHVEDNDVMNTNGGAGIIVGPQAAPCVIHNNRVSGGDNTGISVGGGAGDLATVTNNEVTGNAGVGLNVSNPNVVIDGNLVTGNGSTGVEIPGVSGGTITVTNNTIAGNTPTGSSTPGGLLLFAAGDQDFEVTGNVIYDNEATGVSGPGGVLILTTFQDTTSLVNNTISGNTGTGSGIAGGVHILDSPGTEVSLDNNIISFNVGGGMICGATGSAVIATCNDLYGNAGGDAICGTDGGGNFSLDPLFCDAAGGDFTLTNYSPCIAGACGQVGALGLGCPDPRPLITCAEDVGNDQGRYLRLCWERSYYDDAASGTPVLAYDVYRRQDAFFKAQADNKLEVPGPMKDTGVTQLLGWDYVASVPARTEDYYQTVVTTLCDSTIANGDCWSVFFISARTASPATFWDSEVDSGYSLDNLAPTSPGFVVQYNAPGGNLLTWPAGEEPDIAYYNIYSTQNPALILGSGTLVHSTTGTSWTDPVADGWTYTYMMTAVDLAGNESDASSPVSATGIGDATPPERYALHQNIPNPFNPTTVIRYDVPSPGGDVTLTIYDVSGKRVRTLVDRYVGAGEQSAMWDARDDAGQRVASGVYFYRIEAPGYTATRKLTLLQ